MAGFFALVRSFHQHGISVGEEQDMKDQCIAGFGVVLIVKSRTYYGMRYQQREEGSRKKN